MILTATSQSSKAWSPPWDEVLINEQQSTTDELSSLLAPMKVDPLSFYFRWVAFLSQISLNMKVSGNNSVTASRGLCHCDSVTTSRGTAFNETDVSLDHYGFHCVNSKGPV